MLHTFCLQENGIAFSWFYHPSESFSISVGSCWFLWLPPNPLFPFQPESRLQTRFLVHTKHYNHPLLSNTIGIQFWYDILSSIVIKTLWWTWRQGNGHCWAIYDDNISSWCLADMFTCASRISASLGFWHVNSLPLSLKEAGADWFLRLKNSCKSHCLFWQEMNGHENSW